MMKKISIVIAALLLISVFLGGCTPGESENESEIWSVIPYIDETSAEYFSYTENGEGVCISSCSAEETGIRIPASINGKPVTKIDCTFDGAIELVFPDTVTAFGKPVNEMSTSLQYANFPAAMGEAEGFGDLSDLKAVYIPEGITSVSEYCFIKCGSLEVISLPSTLNYIGSQAFFQCKSLTAVKVPEGVTTLKEKVFAECGSLVDVSLPSTLTSIDIYAFSCCSSLEELKIPDSVSSLGWNAFEFCPSLKEMVIPDGVTILPEFAFQECSSLVSLSLPDSITFIGPWAIYLCNDIEVQYKGNSYDYAHKEDLYSAING